MVHRNGAGAGWNPSAAVRAGRNAAPRVVFDIAETPAQEIENRLPKNEYRHVAGIGSTESGAGASTEAEETG